MPVPNQKQRFVKNAVYGQEPCNHRRRSVGRNAVSRYYAFYMGRLNPRGRSPMPVREAEVSLAWRE